MYQHQSFVEKSCNRSLVLRIKMVAYNTSVFKLAVVHILYYSYQQRHEFILQHETPANETMNTI